MHNRLRRRILSRLPIQKFRELRFEFLEIALEERLIGKLRIFPDELHRNVAGVILVGENVALHRAWEEILLLLSGIVKLLVERVLLFRSHLNFYLQRMYAGT